MFPTGSAGFALVVLRSVVAITVLVDASGNWPFTFAPVIDGFVAVVGLFLLPGFMTPYCATISCLVELTLLLTMAASNWFQFLMSALTSAAAAILGPGLFAGWSNIWTEADCHTAPE
jgi:hypothetical protein